jgi:Dna[CI] antecedent DciA-like protein
MYRLTKPNPGPEPLREILARLITARGWGQRQARLHLERAWTTAMGGENETGTRILGLRRGVFEVEVNNAVLLQELASFQKRKLLAKLRECLPNHTVNDLRFKAGTW